MYNKDLLEFRNVYPDGSITWEDVYYDNILIGAFGTKRSGFLEEQECFYQICVDEELKDFGDGWYISEDEGKVFVTFNGIDGDERLYKLYLMKQQ